MCVRVLLKKAAKERKMYLEEHQDIYGLGKHCLTNSSHVTDLTIE